MNKADNSLIEHLLALYSFDFQEMLDHPTVQCIYLNYLALNKRHESLLFYQSVTLFKRVSTDKCRYHMAMYIIKLFLYDNGEMQINVSNETKTKLLYQKISEQNTPLTYFDSAQRIVAVQLREETFSDFVSNCVELKRFLAQELRTKPLRPLPQSIRKLFIPKNLHAMDFMPIAEFHAIENGIKRGDFISLQHLTDSVATAAMWRRHYKLKNKYTVYTSRNGFDKDGFLTMKIDAIVPYDLDSVLSCLLIRQNRCLYDNRLTHSKSMGFVQSCDGIRSLVTCDKYKLGCFSHERSCMIYHSIKYNKLERKVYIPYRSFKPAEEVSKLDQPRVIRSQVIGGFYLSELPDGKTRIVHVDYMNPHGWVPSSLFNATLRSRAHHFYQMLTLLLQHSYYGSIKNYRTTALLKIMCR